MRAEAIFPLTLLLAGCAVDIGSEPGAAPKSTAALPVLRGCLPLSDQTSALSGRVSLVNLPDQSSLVLADSAFIAGEASSAAFAQGDSDCLNGSAPLPARPIIDTSALGSALRGRPLAAVTASNTFLYFSAEHADGLATDGVGVARWDADSGRFVALGLLWTADRPSFGSAAVLVGDEVYVFGGLAARFLAADVYLARVPSAALSEPSAYEYWQGGGNFGPDADLAQPLVEGGQSPSVAFSPAQNRWLMLYATPLGTDVTVRTGLDVTGPWSAPHPLGHCDLPTSDPGAFCGDLSLMPALAGGTDIAFTQAVASFSRPGTASARDFWTRLVRTPWPSALP